MALFRSRRQNLHYPDSVDVHAPNRATVDFVRQLNPRPALVAEIGVYRGHTSRELARLLPEHGELHLYDFASTVEPVVKELRAKGYRVIGFGNSTKLFDSYNWSLMRMLEQHQEPIYDYVFLDGAHTWAHDALAFLLVDRLLKIGGHLDFDDYSWTFARSPSLNPDVFPKTSEWYTDEQITTPQVERVVELLVRRDPRYDEIVRDRVFRKVR